MSKPWEGGKGDTSRSGGNQYKDNWEKIFGNKKKTPEEELEPVKNDGPILPNGLARHWKKKVDKDVK